MKNRLNRILVVSVFTSLIIGCISTPVPNSLVGKYININGKQVTIDNTGHLYVSSVDNLKSNYVGVLISDKNKYRPRLTSHSSSIYLGTEVEFRDDFNSLVINWVDRNKLIDIKMVYTKYIQE